MWHGWVSYERWKSCGMLNVMWVGKASAVLDLVQNACPMYTQVWHKASFKVGTRQRSVIQKCLWPCQHPPKKRCLRHKAINLDPPRRVRAWKEGPLRFEEYVDLGHVMWMLSLSSLNRLLSPESQQTQPDLCHYTMASRSVLGLLDAGCQLLL